MCERNDDVTYLFIASVAACKKVNTPRAGRSIDAACAQIRLELACIPEAKVGICRRLVQWKEHAVGLFLYDSDFLKCKQSFHPVPRSIDAARVRILSNAALTLTVVCDVTVSSHLSTLNIFTV